MEAGGEKLKLYSYYGSSCAWRVRIALNLKGLNYEYTTVNLSKGEQHSEEYKKLNPVGYVPTLVDQHTVIADSLAIILYLEEKYPQHPLLPEDLQNKAISLQAANIVSSSIQPLQNLAILAAYIVASSLQPLENRAILKYIEEKVSPYENVPWIQYHIGKGFTALEKLLKGFSGKYATGDEVSLADVFLAPQIDAAITRFQLDMTRYPLLSRLNEVYKEIPAFQSARPEKQPDYVKP